MINFSEMELSDTQKAKVTEWVTEGRSLADVQRLLREELNQTLTYMDVRFLVDDLNIKMEDSEPEDSENPQASEEAVMEPEVVDAGGAVSVDVDAVMRPGALISGTVRFSDGVSLGWQLGASGQLGLIPGDDPEYRPNPEDVQAFQAQLEEVLRQKGF